MQADMYEYVGMYICLYVCVDVMLCKVVWATMHFAKLLFNWSSGLLIALYVHWAYVQS